MIRHAAKAAMHARNRFRDGYDFQQLVAASPSLAPFVKLNAYGAVSIDYAAPAAVAALNRALLASAYGLTSWDVPPGYLYPPIPGRSDYVHHLADLLAGHDPSAIPRSRGFGRFCSQVVSTFPTRLRPAPSRTRRNASGCCSMMHGPAEVPAFGGLPVEDPCESRWNVSAERLTSEEAHPRRARQSRPGTPAMTTGTSCHASFQLSRKLSREVVPRPADPARSHG